MHQDQPDHTGTLDGNERIDSLNSEANAIREQTVYYDIRFRAYIPGSAEPVQLIINLEIQLNDTPGYPLVTRGFYYCARMISEQYGTVFTGEHYEELQKVYSIWICPDPAKNAGTESSAITQYRIRYWGNLMKVRTAMTLWKL